MGEYQRLEDVVKGKQEDGCFVIRPQCPALPKSPAEFIARNYEDWKNGKKSSLYVPMGKTLFLDTETAGLGMRHPIWCIGAGYVEDGKWHLAQYVAPTPLEERAMLDKFNTIATQRPYWISYNGASFDIPRLRKRGTQHQLKVMPGRHIDLLGFTRDILRKQRLKNCKLGTIERLYWPKHARLEDLPGHLIPGAYYNYHSRNGSPELLAKAIAHNAEDILTLAALYLKALREKWIA